MFFISRSFVCLCFVCVSDAEKVSLASGSNVLLDNGLKHREKYAFLYRLFTYFAIRSPAFIFWIVYVELTSFWKTLLS